MRLNKKSGIFSLLFIFAATLAYADVIGGIKPDGHIIQDEGTSLRQRPYLNFTGSGVTCSDSGGKSVCNITGTDGGGGISTTYEEEDAGGATAETVDFQAGFDKDHVGLEMNLSLDLGEIMSGGATADSSNVIYLNETDPQIGGIGTSDTVCVSNGYTVNCYLDVWTEAENTAAGYISATLTEEEVEDYAGGMVTGNTETLITVTYQDNDGTIDFTVDNDLSHYSNVTSAFIKAADVPANETDSAHDTCAEVTGCVENAITAAQVPANETDASHDECSEISGCVENALTSESDPQVGGVTADSVCQGNGTTINCDLDVWTEAENTAAGYISSETDDQTIDVSELDGTTLKLSLEDDGEATKEIDLSSLQDGDTKYAAGNGLQLAGTTFSLFFGSSSIVTEAEGIAGNDNDTTLPTSAAVKDYADSNDDTGTDDQTCAEVSGCVENALTSEDDPQVGGVTADSVAVGNGVTLNAEKAIDSSGDCVAGSVCGGGHSHSDKQAADADLTSLAGGISGIVKGSGDGGGYAAASAGTDYLATEDDPQVGGVTADSVVMGNGISLNAEKTLDATGDCDAGNVCGGGHTHSSYLENISGEDLSTADNSSSNFITTSDVPGAETDPQVGGVTADSVAIGNGVTLNAEKSIDASGACGAGTVCGGGHTHASPIDRCVTIEMLKAADDNIPTMSWSFDPTITEAWCTCFGTCTTAAEFNLEDDGGNAFTMASMTCGTAGSAPSPSTVTTDTVTAYETMRFDVTNSVSPETDWYEICVKYSVTSSN